MRTAGSAIGMRRPELRARRADREHERAADRMPVGRDHAPTHDMRAGPQRRNRDVEICISCADIAECNSAAARSDQTDRERRHRFVECEPQRSRRRAITAPSTGSAFTSVACAKGARRMQENDEHRRQNRRERSAHRRDLLSLRQKLQPRCRLRIVAGSLAVSRNLDPAVHALFAFLHHREIQHLAGNQIVGEISLEHEFIIMRIRQFVARPRYLGHALADLGVKQL